MRAVVVGGGIIGLSSAYSLAEAGADVVLLEKGSLGTGNTGRAAGGIRQQFSTPVNVELSKRSDRVWSRFEATFGVDIEHRRVGYLFLAREAATAAQFEQNVAMHHEHGVTTQLLDPDELSDYCQEVDTELFEAGTYLGTDGFADPALAVQGYAKGADRAGVKLSTGVAVTDLIERDGRVVGVRTEDGDHEADVVVNVAGAWIADIAAMAGVDLAVSPRRRQLVLVDPEVSVPESVPLTIDLDTGSYFRPERDGIALVGGHFGGTDQDADPDRFRSGFDMDWAVTAIEAAGEWTGYFGPESRIRDGWAGLYAVTPDHHPIVDEVKPGLVVAGGFSGHGFMHAPATGQVVAELALDGTSSLPGIERLAADRFASGAISVEHNVV